MSEFEEKEYINLMKDIKAPQIINKVFSFLKEKKKLNLIIYNKEIKENLEVNIQDYIKTSGKYKIGGKNGKGSEYTIRLHKLIFEGEYLNGRRNGKGKEYYYNGKPKFEGEYLKGKRWNGKGYNINDNVEFEIKDGKGKGKEYNFNFYLDYEGEYLNGEKNGKGK